MKSEEKQEDNLLELMLYQDKFMKNFYLLLRRYKRFKEVDKQGNRDIDVVTYFDIIMVQIRALLIENPVYKKNYTAQIFLKNFKRQELSKKIDDMLETQFFEEEMFIIKTKNGGKEKIPLTIKEVIKILTDKFICHYDSLEGNCICDLADADFYMNRFRDPWFKNNLDYIMDIIISCVGGYLNYDNEIKNKGE